jgi:hypothetical protein
LISLFGFFPLLKDFLNLSMDDSNLCYDGKPYSLVKNNLPNNFIAISGPNNSGAFLNLMTRDGKEDRILTALDQLEKRMTSIRTSKMLLNMEDTAPTMAELEQSHVIFIKGSFKPYIPVASEYIKQSPVGGNKTTFGGELKFEIPNYGDFIADQVLHIVISGFGIKDGDANLVNSYRYAAFPGIKLCENTDFSIGNVTIDKYTTIDMLFQSNFMLEGHKKLALARAVGQQEDKYAGYYMPDNQINVEIKYTDGPQTPKTYQPELELWIPLVFWHNILPANALSQRKLPWGQRFITINLANIRDVITARAPGGTTKIPLPADIIDQITIKKAELYTNNLFIGADIHDIYMKRLNFNFIRIHNHMRTIVTNQNDRIKLENLKYPTEFMYVGFRPVANNTPEKWTDLVILEEKSFITPVYNGAVVVPQIVTYKNKIMPVSTLGITSSGVTIFENTNIQFYEDYLPFSRSNTAVGLRGAILIPFNLKTGETQPSGYLNLSRNKETYITWTGGKFDLANQAELFISSIALNFLVVKDNKAWLLY